MAIVAMGITGSKMKWKGGYSSELVGCLYCDQCGSFSIGRRITARNIVGLVAALVVPFLLWNTDRSYRVFPVSLLFFALFLVYALESGVLDLGYGCKKCRNRRITTETNCLGYQAYDRSVLDVPYEATKKLYIWDP
jgi:hypothetical protein